jgi:hypothetical protein
MRAVPIFRSVAAALALAALAIADLRGAADGWRAAFLLLSAPSIGAVALLLIARVVGADWDAALMPMLPALAWLGFLAIPVVVGQALFHDPDGHLHLWLSPLAFTVRSVLALLFWWWTARRFACGRMTRPGPLLLAHGLVVSVMAYDWLLGVAPAQPDSVAPMVLAVMQIGGASALACAVGLGTVTQRRDLAYLLVASALGLSYFLYIDFVIVWFGNLPAHVGWYVDRDVLPASLSPALALLLGLLAPILLVGLARSDTSRRWAGRSALLALGLVAVWIVAGPGGWIGLGAALAAMVAVGGLAREVWA